MLYAVGKYYPIGEFKTPKLSGDFVDDHTVVLEKVG